MDLKPYVTPLDAPTRDAFAILCGTTWGHLRNCMYGYKPFAPQLCVAIERATEGVVTRRDLRPDDWHLIWPELADTPSVAVKEASHG